LFNWNYHRKGSKFGHDTLIDGMLKDGLWDVYNNFPMGMCAELCADQHSFSREEQVCELESFHFNPLKTKISYILYKMRDIANASVAVVR
jgi:Thiolase, N-terminal domain